ncbi:zinc transport system ATP-binding protein [Caminicella sporogenes DSM 14501]|uniref:Zinc transport system ATP-binding protein n=1 Tax=Caminicella sporogenes DSM 14501 TaxID=1121266 RepID=A0A1M6T4W3_9FIRM|nr:metal ABC transporter ATP-binding protein [Caminicella sporogenes]RKD25484.1 zinc ABC transporter ATP-binding protein [Caminicella sporogenes]WIF95990.1 metal ABC transporter ATP-binding protein [Caminicella sporogenes]SHK51838.1 zinc transport system ATP-binding protein [Caminicella sporogenes DSM 14501]
MEKIVTVKDLYFGYDEKLILENINLDVFKGDYLGIVGPNGAAKSTLIKLILGLLKPQKGKIKLFGQDIEKFKDWGRVGYVAQKATSSFNSSFPATVEEVVSVNLYPKIGLFKSIKKVHMEKVYDVLKIVGMDKFGKRLIGNLSGGQQQKVFIARTLVSEPEIIFLDEPTVGIDINSQLEFYDLLERLNKEMKITIVMISHDIGVITEKVSRVACMGSGKLIVHNSCCNVPFKDVLSRFYGEKMKLLIHHHNH